MTQAFFAQILISLLLLLPVLHVLAKDKEKTRSAALCSLLAVITAFFSILAYGLSASFLVLLISSVFSFIFTFRSFARFSLGLAVVHTGFSYVSAVLQLLVLGASFTFCVMFRPVPIPQKNIQNTPVIEKYMYTVADATASSSKAFQNASVEATLFRPKNMGYSVPVFLYIPGMFGDSQTCFATAYLLAQKGAAVLIPDFAWGETMFASIRSKIFSASFTNRMQELYSYNDFLQKTTERTKIKQAELEHTLTMFKEGKIPAAIERRDVYLLTDGTDLGFSEILRDYGPSLIRGMIHINEKTTPDSDGKHYGNLSVFHPFEAYLRKIDPFRDIEWNSADTIATTVLEDYNELFGLR